MGAEQSGRAYFSLRHLNINLCDLFISPDVPLQSRLHQLSNRAPQLYFLSSCLLNCSFLILKTKRGWFVSLLWFSSGVRNADFCISFFFFFKVPSRLEDAECCRCNFRRTVVFFVQPHYVFLSWLPSGVNLLCFFYQEHPLIIHDTPFSGGFLASTGTACLSVSSDMLLGKLQLSGP